MKPVLSPSAPGPKALRSAVLSLSFSLSLSARMGPHGHARLDAEANDLFRPIMLCSLHTDMCPKVEPRVCRRCEFASLSRLCAVLELVVSSALSRELSTWISKFAVSETRRPARGGSPARCA